MGRAPNLEKRKATALEGARRAYHKAMRRPWETYQHAIDLIEQEYKEAKCNRPTL